MLLFKYTQTKPDKIVRDCLYCTRQVDQRYILIKKGRLSCHYCFSTHLSTLELFQSSLA